MEDNRIGKMSEFLILGSLRLGIEDTISLFKDERIQKILSELDDQTVNCIKDYILNLKDKEVGDICKNIDGGLNNEDIFLAAGDYFSNEIIKKNQGAVFTPKWLAQMITERTINHYKEYFNEQPIYVGDLSCGSGSFLNQLATSLETDSKIYANDINKEYIFAAKLLNQFENIEFACLDTLIELNNSEQISLFESESVFKNNNYDLIVGNPPYVRSQNLEEPYIEALKAEYDGFLDGNFDLTVPFIVNTINLLKDKGIAGLVVSNKFLTSKYGKQICNLLSRNTRIIEIIDFGDGQVFKGKTTYTCVIIFQKIGYDEKLANNLISVTSFDSGTQWDSVGSAMKKAKIVSIEQSKLFAHPWRLNNPLEEEILNKIDNIETTVSITSIFEKIIQGVRTGANKVFILDEKNKDIVENDVLREFIDGTNIRKFSIEGINQFLIWPYEFDSSNGKVKLKNYSEESYPKFNSYMELNKSVLESRSIEKEDKIFQFSRSQNIIHMFKPKILIREMMPSIQIAADLEGKYAFSSGYALIAKDMTKEEYHFWTAILNTPIMEYQFRKKTTQLHRGWFRVLKSHLVSLRLPIFSTDEIMQIKKVIKNLNGDNLEALSLLNEIIIDKLGLDEQMITHINDFLKRNHEVSHSNLQPKIEDKKILDIKQKINVDEISDSYYKELSIDSRLKYLPVEITKFNKYHINSPELNKLVTFQKNKGDVPIHNWYHYTQGFSKDLIKYLLDQIGYKRDEVVFDPFVGSGTTLLACKELGIDSIGTDISPLMTWITKLKISDWDSLRLKEILKSLDFENQKEEELEDMLFMNYLLKAYSPKILQQILGWRKYIEKLSLSKNERDFILLGLISILEEISLIRKHGSHYRFLNKEDNVGVNKLNIKTVDENININGILKDKLWKMVMDIERNSLDPSVMAKVFTMNARDSVPEGEAGFVITSPPYLNRNNYFAQQKAELSITGILNSEKEYKRLVKDSYKSHVEASFKNDVVSDIPEVNEILNKVKLTENNNPKIPHMICGYFDDLQETLISMKSILKHGSKLAFVVGNSRWGGVVVPVDHLLALIAERVGYKLEKILVARYKGNSPQQMAKYGKIPVRESVVVLELV
ncbi:Eco57I restriction-modification methylase domain-containing protein [Ureibacillus sp. GCM10028918]|uniref:Eco57I restriction-modification methylase domain-containing protein n=1 Tax=Ureibacillus sp. GCM10028918 TaxID=3273429 RepID=UPI0036133045